MTYNIKLSMDRYTDILKIIYSIDTTIFSINIDAMSNSIIIFFKYKKSNYRVDISLYSDFCWCYSNNYYGYFASSAPNSKTCFEDVKKHLESLVGV